MNIRTVRARVNQIASVARDFEAAHAKEDELYVKVLSAIAYDNISIEGAKELCHEALKTKTISFPRYCA